MQRADLAFCDELRRLAGWNQRLEDWALYLRLAPRGCFVAELEDRPVGSVTTIDYEKKMGWIGMLIVHPGCRGGGVGSHLLEHAVEHLQTEGVRTIKLDATPQGEPLYKRIGFESELQITRWIAKPPHTSVNHPLQTRAMKAADLTAAIRLDEKAFGAARGALLRELHKESIQSIVYDINGTMVGFAMLRPGTNANYLGPVLGSEATTLALAAIANSPARDILWDIPDFPPGEKLARELGFTPQRILTRMRLGPKCDTGLGVYWGLIDPACG